MLVGRKRSSAEPRGGKAATSWLIVAVLAALVAGGYLWFRSRPPAPVAEQSLASLELAIESLAAAEDGKFEQALEGWRKLATEYPDERAFQINEAVTVLKWIEVSDTALGSGQIQDPEAIALAEAALEKAYSQADAVMEKLQTAPDAANGRIVLLQAALLEAKASRVQGAAQDEIKVQAAKLLATSLQANPQQPLLAAKFDDLALPLGSEGDELWKQDTEFLYQAWRAEPRNLYLLGRAARMLLSNKDSRLLELLEPSVELSKPMQAEVARDMRMLKLDQLVPDVRQAVSDGEWRKAFPFIRWLNVIGGMSGFRSDSRLVKPDVLALLDTSFLNEFADQFETSRRQQSGLAGTSFANAGLSTEANDVVWYDFDLDLDFDLLTLSNKTVSVFSVSDGELAPTPVHKLELEFAHEGCLVAEFFKVDETSRLRRASSVAELMSEGGQASAEASMQPTESQEPAQEADRHNTYQEVLCWGPSGCEFVQVVVGQEADATNQTVAGLAKVTTETGLEHLRGVRTMAVADIESDGDLDLLVATQEGLRVFQNNGNRTFRDVTEYSDMSQCPNQVEHIAIGDIDEDLDLDAILVASDGGSFYLLENILHSQFRVRPLDGELWPTLASATGAAIGELDGNASWDFIAASVDGTAVARTRTPAPGNVLPLTSSTLDFGSTCLDLGDLNNDGFIDVVVGGSAGLAVHFGESTGTLSPAMLLSNASGSVEQVRVIDANQDGVLDLALVESGQARVLWGEPKRANYLSARVRGIDDSNGGGRINHFCVGTTLEVWGGGRQQRRIVTQPATHFGLGEDVAENLRVVFTNGLTQNVEAPPINTNVEEKQELKGSCPFIYGWDGQRFRLITDALWNAPLGLQVARGEVLQDRRWENLLLPAEWMQPKDGFYELRLTEELWEVAYFDHVRLTAVDHPTDVRVFTNEKVGPPSIAQHRLFEFSKRLYADVATDSQGRDVRAELAAVDRNYVRAFDRVVHQGLVEPHFVELYFGRLPTDTFLCLNGWMHPTDTSLNIGLAQNPDRQPPEPPSLWVVAKDGSWQCAKPFAGFPGGKPKSIVIDLADVFISDDHRIRIASSQQIYWDEAFVATVDSASAVEQTLVLESAELRYRGFSKLLPKESDQPHWYDYTQVSLAPKWPELEGPFTRFGDVKNLLVADDNAMVVMTSGDEIVLRFVAASKPLPDGWRRDFVLHSTGWDKDADINTLAGKGSLPLPFAMQSQYPPSEAQAVEARAVWEKNKGTLSRLRQVQLLVE